MRQTASRGSLLLAAALVGFGLLAGCAAEKQAAPTLRTSALLQQADQAFQNEDYGRARSLYLTAQQHADRLSMEQRTTVQNRLTRIDSVLHERSIAEEAAPKPAAPKPAEEPTEEPAEKPAEEPAAEEPSEAPAAEAPAPETAEAEAKKDLTEQEAAERLERAERLVQEQKYDDAVPLLAAVESARARMPAQMQLRYDQVRHAVQRATGELPELAHEVKVERGEWHLDRGLELYDQNEYRGALRHLKVAKAYDVSLGWWDNRKLRGALEEVESTLSRLRGAYQAGKTAYEAEDFKTARPKLSEVAESDVRLKDEVHQDVEEMLSGIDRKIAEQERELAEAVREKAAKEAAARAEKAEELAAEAETLLQVRQSVERTVQQGEQAQAAEDYEKAEKLYEQALETVDESEMGDAPAMRQLAGTVESELEAARRQKAEQQRMVAARKELKGRVEEAVKTAESDLRAAEKKALQAQRFAEGKGIALTAEQQKAIAQVMQQVEEAFGAQRRLQREQYGWIESFVERYQSAGKWNKAADLLALLKEGEEGRVSRSVLQWARAQHQAARQRAEEQMQKAGQLAERFDTARDALQKSGLEAALAKRQEIMREAGEAELTTDEAVRKVTEADAAFLEVDAAEGLEALRKTIGQRAEKLLDEAVAALENRSYEQPPLELQQETDELYELAQKLNRLAREGSVGQAALVQQQIADVRTKVAAQKANRQVALGDLEQAVQLLEQAPADRASEEAVNTYYEPAKKLGDGAKEVAEDLNAAENAIRDHQFAHAAKLVNRVQDAEALPAPQRDRLEALAGVLDPVREALDTLRALENNNRQALKQAQARLEDLRGRAEAWQAYVTALETVLEDGAEAAGRATAEAAKRSRHMLAFERQNLQAIGTALADADKDVVAGARKRLQEAQKMFENGQYGAAADALDKVEKAPGYTLSEDVRQRAVNLAEKIQKKEQEARALYEKAVAAWKTDDAAEVRRLTSRLKREYAGTEAYQELE